VKIAVLHNLRPPSVTAVAPDDWFEEYDSAETIAAICTALAGLGVEPVPIVADRRLPSDLEKGKFDFAFNIAEGVGRRCRAAVAAAVCELIGLPYTGSDPLTLAVTQDKAVARRIVSPNIPVAPAVLVDNIADAPGLAALDYPVIVKPNDEGSSKGIGNGSVCRSPEAAAARCRWLRARYGCPALVEEFLPGMEVTAAVHGNGAACRILGLMEIAPTRFTQSFVYDIDVKRNWRRRVQYYTPPRLPGAMCDAVEALALEAYQLLGCRDIARIDFRFDAEGRAHFLECNPLPGLDPANSDIVILSREILAYDDLVRGILLDAAQRTGTSIG
jgi:D-alanine-D-alanine ligase